MPSSKPNVAIIGAGVSGLGAALGLADRGIRATIFEKSRGSSGRAASRTMNGIRVDHGANYFKTDRSLVSSLVHDRLPTDELIEIEGDISVFDAAGVISPGDPAQHAEPKWNYRKGISTLGKLIAAECDADIRFQSRISHLEKDATGRWRLVLEGGEPVSETYDHVIFSCPAPQARAILAQSTGLGENVACSINEGLRQAKYHRQFAFVFDWNQELESPGKVYALINGDREHPISWISFENGKPGRVPSGHTVVVAQMSPEWSDANFDASPASLGSVVHETLAGVLGGRFHEAPMWNHSQRWGFSLPYVRADETLLAAARPAGLYFIGDMLLGKGRVGESLETGLTLRLEGE